MKNSNVREFPIARDILLITYAESGVKQRGLLGSIHANTNDAISSHTIICYLAPPQLRPMIDHQKMMCGCAICSTSKYFQESFHLWQWKQLKIMKDKSYNSRGRVKYESTHVYK